MVKLWTCEINLETGEIDRHESDHEEGYESYDSAEEAYENGCMFGSAGYADLDFAEGCVYAESIVSQADADRLVREKCKELFYQFQSAYLKMEKLRQ